MANEAAIVLHGTETAALAHPAAPVLEFTAEQRQMIRNTYANGATEQEFAVLLEIAKTRRLNPLLRQIHFVKRWDPEKQVNVWSAQASIDGMRAIAERTGKYDGQDEPKYEEDGNGIVSCRVKVWRKDWKRPAVGIAYWSEFVQTKKDGQPTRFWREKPRLMIAKCAEAQALRKAFPEDLSNLYAPEEMQGGRVEQEEPAIESAPDSNPDPRPQATAEESARTEASLAGTQLTYDLLRSLIATAKSEEGFREAYKQCRDARLNPSQRRQLRAFYDERVNAWNEANRPPDPADDELPEWAGGKAPPEDEERAAIQGA